jgi:hypothetical protein
VGMIWIACFLLEGDNVKLVKYVVCIKPNKKKEKRIILNKFRYILESIGDQNVCK